MGVAKVSLTIDSDVLAEARARAGRRELSAYVSDALAWKLQADRLDELLAAQDEEHGPIPTADLEEARRAWQPSDDPEAPPRS